MALQYVFNPLTGNFDYVDIRSGETASKYVDTFAVNDWVLNVNEYELIILSSTHDKGANAQAEVFEFASGEYEKVNVNIKINSNNDIVIAVSNVPDLRFIGKILIN